MTYLCFVLPHVTNSDSYIPAYHYRLRDFIIISVFLLVVCAFSCMYLTNINDSCDISVFMTWLYEVICNTEQQKTQSWALFWRVILKTLYFSNAYQKIDR